MTDNPMTDLRELSMMDNALYCYLLGVATGVNLAIVVDILVDLLFR